MDPGALRARPGPQKRGFLPNLSAPGVLGQGGSCNTFLESGQRGKENVMSGILIFGPRPEKTGLEAEAGQGADQSFGIAIFLIKRTPAKSGTGRFLFYATF